MWHDPLTIAAIALGIALLAGIVAGCQGSIVVFADLHDLLVTFSIVATGALIVFLLADVTSDHLRERLSIAAVLVPLAAIWLRSRDQNKTTLATALAVLTKLPFAVAAPLLILQIAAPSGTTASKRAANRASALLMLTILGPLLMALVRDKSGMRRYIGGV